MFSLESPIENTQHTFMLKKIGKISLFCLLIWRYDLHSLAQTPLSRTYFHGPKGVRAIEVFLYIETYLCLLKHVFTTQYTLSPRRIFTFQRTPTGTGRKSIMQEKSKPIYHAKTFHYIKNRYRIFHFSLHLS